MGIIFRLLGARVKTHILVSRKHLRSKFPQDEMLAPWGVRAEKTGGE